MTAKALKSLQKKEAARTRAAADVMRKEPSTGEPIIPTGYAAKTLNRLDDVAARLKAGCSYEDVLEELDGLLETGMKERDRATEAAWEKSRR